MAEELKGERTGAEESAKRYTRRDVLRGTGIALAGLGAAAAFGAPGAAASTKTGVAKQEGPSFLRPNRGKRTLIWWEDFAGSKQNARLALVAAFQKANPDIAVQMETIFSPEDLDAKVLTAMTSGVVPDLITNEWFYNTAYAFQERLQPLDQYLERSHITRNELNGAALATGIVDDSVYCIPNYTNDLLLTYNATIAKQCGLDPSAPPENWAELQQWAIAMTQQSNGTVTRAGFFYEDTSFYFTNEFALFLWGAGGNFFTDDNKHVLFNNDAGVEALTFMTNLITRYNVATPLFGQGLQGAQTPLYDGTEAMTIGFPPTIVNAKPYNLDLGLAPFPKKDGGRISTIDPFTTCIPKDAKNKSDAWSFIDFMLREEQQVNFALPTNNIPALKAAAASPEVKSDSVIEAFAHLLPVCKPLPIIEQYAGMQPIITQAVQNAYYNRVSPKGALDAAAEQVAALMGI